MTSQPRPSPAARGDTADVLAGRARLAERVRAGIEIGAESSASFEGQRREHLFLDLGDGM